VIPITVIIRDILAVPAQGAYYFDDLTALQANPISVSERYTAEPVAPGFRRVREVAEALSVGLVLDDPATRSGYQVAWGDCVAVEFSGKAGRNPLFRAEEGLSTIQGTVAPALRARELTGFRQLAAEVDALVESVEITRTLPPPRPGGESEEGNKRLSRRELLATPARLLRRAGGEAPTPTEQVTVDRPLHTAIRYGVSQALLAAVALARGVTMAQVVAEEYQLPLLTGPQSPAAAGRVEAVPIHAQCGADRYAGADKMIVRRVASLPHTLVDNIPEQLGEDGEILVRYAHWLRERIPQLADENYRPTIHLDVHGALGQIYDNSLGKILGYLYRLEQAVAPYPLRVESPLILDSREAQIEAFKTLRDYIRIRKMRVELVADEWANTLEDIQAFVAARAADMIQIKMPDLGSVHNSIQAVLTCKSAGVGAFLGGSCAETDLSARVAVHIALVTRPDMIMAKPGMGVDEGVALVYNEMARTLAWIQARERRKSNGTRSGAEKT
jgi:methylaspartate ammonia-lyase